MSTIFGKIIRGEVLSDVVFENNRVLVIKDIAPVAPVHFLLIPKKEYENLQSVPEEELDLIKEIVKIAQGLAEEFKVEDNYRLLTNNGRGAGQTVFHLHFHLIGGKELGSID